MFINVSDSHKKRFAKKNLLNIQQSQFFIKHKIYKIEKLSKMQ